MMIKKYSVTIAKDTEKFSWDIDHNIDILVDESKAIINLKIDSKKWPVTWDQAELLDMSRGLLDWILETDHSRILSISSEIVA
jgi:hypothetical protein